MISRPLAAVALAAACLFASPRARADEQSDFEKGRAAYATKNYDDADRRFREMLDPSVGTLHDPALVTEARMYWAATMFAMNRRPEAAALVEKLLLARPEYEPDPLRFPQDVINFFIDTRSKIVDKINAAKAAAARAAQEAHDRDVAAKAREARRLALLEQLASQEVEVEHHSRLFALLPFGAGQFQNGSPTLGWVLFGVESAFFLGTAATLAVYRLQLSESSRAYVPGRPNPESDQWLSRARSTRTVNLILVGAFAATAIAGVVQAELTFVPEIVIKRPRAIPSVGWVAPMITPLTAPNEIGVVGVVGGVIGIEGRF
jgi:hypothetical protein